MTASKKVSLGNKIAYGFGSVALALKIMGLIILLIFYSQVMGVSAYLVSLALLIALVFDALSDPLIGYVSDNTRSRWGRRQFCCMQLRFLSPAVTFSSGIRRPVSAATNSFLILLELQFSYAP